MCWISGNDFELWEWKKCLKLRVNIKKYCNCKEIQPVHSEGDQPWDFFGRNDAEAETPVLRPPHVKSWLIGKDSDSGRDWGQEEKGTTEDEMAGWHHWLDGRESEWTPGVGDGQGGLACWDSWGRKESDTTEQLNWTELNWGNGFELWEWKKCLKLRVNIKKYCKSLKRKITKERKISWVRILV